MVGDLSQILRLVFDGDCPRGLSSGSQNTSRTNFFPSTFRTICHRRTPFDRASNETVLGEGKNAAFIIALRLASNAPVIGTVGVGGRRINLIINKPAEPSISTQSEAITSPSTGVPTVSVQVTHDEDVVRVPVSLHSGVDVHQRFHLFHGRVRVCMEAYQHQLLHSCNSEQ